YQCRHTFATRLAASGVSDTIIDQLLGHSRRDVLRFYTARVVEYLRDAMMRLDQLRTTKTEMPVASRISALDEPPRRGPLVVN
ncbi:MAG: tyrosine-type recombinase/integrase, partial [Terriglobales bacterium]